MKLRSLAAAMAVALGVSSPPLLSGCAQDGGLKPSAREKLTEVIGVARTAKSSARVFVMGFKAFCADATETKACVAGMPIAELIDSGLVVLGSALDAAQAALADSTSTDAKLAEVMNSLLSAKADVKKLVGQIEDMQSGELPDGTGKALQATSASLDDSPDSLAYVAIVVE